MKFLESSKGKNRLVWWLGAVVSLFFVCASFLPVNRPQRNNSIDDSWIQVLHFAFLNHLQFGRDIVFTFGPWGFLYTGYQPETYVVSVVIWLVLAAVFWCALRRVARLSFQNELARWIWLMAVTGLVSVSIASNVDARLICFPLLLIILHFFDDGSFAMPLQSALLVSLGLLSLVRFTVFILSAGVMAAIVVDTIWRRRRRGAWSVAVFGGSFLFFWLAGRQGLGWLWSYLRGSWQLTSGYTEAMMMAGPHEMQFVTAFLLVALVLCVILAFALWRRLRFVGALPQAALAFIVFATFKYGFVRDDEHQPTAAVELLVVSLMFMTVEWPVVREQRLGFRAGIFLPVIAAYIFTEFSFGRFDLTPFTRQYVGAFTLEKWLAPLGELSGGPAYRQCFANYRERFPLPRLNGGTDAYSWNQVELFANDEAYSPRPVFQSYSAYTPELAELNAAHLRSDEAARNIVWDGAALDNRYRSLEDGLSWPELLTRYDVRQVEISFAVLTRSPTPRRFTLTPLLDASVKFGQQLSLPFATNNLLWAEIDVGHSAPGSLVSTLYKPPELSINTTFRSGQRHTNRFIPGMARAGFLLSPFVRNSAAFAALASTGWPKFLTDDVVTTFSITQSDSFSPIACYKNPIHVRLYQLDCPRQDLDAVQGYDHVIELMDVVQKATLLQDGELVYLHDEGSVFGVPPDSTILLDRPPGSSRLRLAFGMYVPDGDSNTNGITFQVSALNAQQGKNPLWSRYINPAQSPKDHGKQEASIDLDGKEISRIILQTVSDRSNTSEILRPYWSEIHFE